MPIFCVDVAWVMFWFANGVMPGCMGVMRLANNAEFVDEVVFSVVVVVAEAACTVAKAASVL